MRSLVLLIASLIVVCTEAEAAPKLLWETKGLAQPESVVVDPATGAIYVSNIVGAVMQKDGNGFISRMRPDDNTVDSLHFVAGGRGGATLNAPKGMAIVGDTLYVADIDAVRLFDRHTGKALGAVDLSKMKAHFLNDVVAGPDGAVYITDTGVQFDAKGNTSHPGPDQVFKITGRTASVAVSDSSLAGPNACCGGPTVAAATIEVPAR
jgi:sugar lactone lactonase YvrE